MRRTYLKIVSIMAFTPTLLLAQAPGSSGEIVTTPMKVNPFEKTTAQPKKAALTQASEAAKSEPSASGSTSNSDKFYYMSQIERSYFDGVQLSVNAQIGSYKKEGTRDSFSATGYGLRVGKEFELTDLVTTTSSLNMNFYNLSDDNNLTQGNQYLLDARGRDWGVSQKLSLKRPYNGTVFKPFVELGIAFGKNWFEGNISEAGEIVSYDIATDYTRFSYGLGVEAQLHNNLIPFVRFERSDIQQDDRVTSEVISSKQNITTVSDTDKVRLGASVFTLGLGYQF